jgi:release factor glutamine methyltransferase
VIALSIKKVVGNHLNMAATDKSLGALRIASLNSTIHNLKCGLINTDLFSGLKKCSFDLIISNPPYVEAGYVRQFLSYEPAIALVASEQGFALIKKILKTAHRYLKEGGYLILEIGYNHKDLVENLLKNLAVYETVEWIKDYAGYFRGIALKTQISTEVNGLAQK